MHRIVLLRHGESIWNKDNLFTGWADVDLSVRGRVEADQAGLLLSREGYSFDIAFCSVLKRAIRTMWMVQDAMDLMWIPVVCDWRLNERHYGALQGLNKTQTAARYGAEQVRLWRRSYDVRPPALGREDPRYPGHDPRYHQLTQEQLPIAESLSDTVARVLPCWHERVAPAVQAGKQVLVCAHGNTLRGLVKQLDDISDDAISAVEIPTGVPLVYELDTQLKALRHYYLPQPTPDEIEASAHLPQMVTG